MRSILRLEGLLTTAAPSLSRDIATQLDLSLRESEGVLSPGFTTDLMVKLGLATVDGFLSGLGPVMRHDMAMIITK
jgi:hypothetical protein